MHLVNQEWIPNFSLTEHTQILADECWLLSNKGLFNSELAGENYRPKTSVFKEIASG